MRNVVCRYILLLCLALLVVSSMPSQPSASNKARLGRKHARASIETRTPTKAERLRASFIRRLRRSPEPRVMANTLQRSPRPWVKPQDQRKSIRGKLRRKARKMAARKLGLKKESVRLLNVLDSDSGFILVFRSKGSPDRYASVTFDTSTKTLKLVPDFDPLKFLQQRRRSIHDAVHVRPGDNLRTRIYAPARARAR